LPVSPAIKIGIPAFDKPAVDVVVAVAAEFAVPAVAPEPALPALPPFAKQN
jgi:hypothetical protein